VRSIPTAVAALALWASLASGCDDSPTNRPPAGAYVMVISVTDPDLTDPVNPVPGRLLWYSTREGVAWFISDDREICDRAPVSAGELVTTYVDAIRLIPGINDVEIREVLPWGGDDVVEQVQIFVDAECTWPEHCSGPCVDFACQ
jgi:hypothetical protein